MTASFVAITPIPIPGSIAITPIPIPGLQLPGLLPGILPLPALPPRPTWS